MTIITIQLLWVPDDIKQQYDDDDGILAIQGLCYIFPQHNCQIMLVATLSLWNKLKFNMPPSNWTPDAVQEAKAHGFFGTLGLGVGGWLLSKVG